MALIYCVRILSPTGDDPQFTCDAAHSPRGEIFSLGVSLSSFADLGVPANLVRVLSSHSISEPTPIQTATLPDSLTGRDVLGRGRTGSGKTYAFLLPLVARLDAERRTPGKYRPRSLVLAPTRELANQIAESLKPLADAAGLTYGVVFGGVGQNPQVKALAGGLDVLVACPGRLEDLIGQGFCDLSDIEITILDEADHMADMGFLPGVKRILAQTPSTGQRLLFSATLDGDINVLVKRFLSNPVTHEADSAQSPVVSMEHHVFAVDKDERLKVISNLAAAPGRTVVFTRTKHGAKKLAKQLSAEGIPAVDLHGNLSQNARVRNMEAFHSGAVETLVATDIAARGIHVDDVSLVVHADPPTEHKAYLHRSGRTARAGAAGTVVTMMLPEQRGDVRGLLRAAGIKATTTNVTSHSDMLTQIAPGERVYRSADEVAAAVPTAPVQQESKPRGRGNGERRGGDSGGRSGAARTGRSGSTSARRSSGGRSQERSDSGRAAAGSPSRGGAAAGAGRSGAGARSGASRSGGAAAFSSGSRLPRR